MKKSRPLTAFAANTRTHLPVLALLTCVLVCGCNSPTSPEQQPPGPAAVIGMDSVSAYPGATVTLPITMDYPSGGREQLDTLGGFDFTIIYDSAILLFLTVTQGESISEWEYFTYRGYGRPLCHDCSLLRMDIVALRDIDNHAPVVPPQAYPEGPLFSISFQVSSDWNFIDSTTTIMFGRGSCGDNVFTPQSDQHTYYMANPQFGFDSEEAAFDSMGCARAATIKPVLAFHGGRVTVKEPPPLRGDVDLDGTPFTALDLGRLFDLMYQQGPNLDSAFLPNMIANADCNGDGTPLSIADVEYCSRVTFAGQDTSAILPPPYGETIRLQLQQDEQNWVVGGTSTQTVGGLDLRIVEPSGVPLEADWITGRWSVFSAYYTGDTLRITAIPEFIEPLEGDWSPPIRITSAGASHPVIVSAQASTPPGVLMAVVVEP